MPLFQQTIAWVQEIDILKSLSFDRSIVQFYGTCPWQGKTMLVLEHMEVISPSNT